MYPRETCLLSPLLSSNFLFEILDAPNVEVSEIACLIVSFHLWDNAQNLQDSWMYPLLTWTHHS